MTQNSFAHLGLPEDAVRSLDRRGITQAFPIQTLAIPPALEGRDVSGKAPTGSGKTLAFGLPVAQRVPAAKAKRPKALILTPTRELAAQIEKELRLLLKGRGRSVASFYGGVGFGGQLRQLRQGVDVAVACPGRLADLVRRGAMSLQDVEIVVLDEADRMADMGFLPEVTKLLDQVRPDRQTMLFSATLDGDVSVLVRKYQKDPVRCEVPADESHMERTTHEFVRTPREERIGRAVQLVETHGATVVFCRTKRGADRVADQLRKQGVNAVPIHGGRSQAQRDRALRQFTERTAQVLVATDVAARGIHVNNVRCVLHFDVAGDHKDYVHRSGRTGRAGAQGHVVSFVTDSDVGKVRQLQRALDMPVDGASDGAQERSHRASGGQRSTDGRRGRQRRSRTQDQDRTPRRAGRSDNRNSAGGTSEGRRPGRGQEADRTAAASEGRQRRGESGRGRSERQAPKSHRSGTHQSDSRGRKPRSKSRQNRGRKSVNA